MVYNSTRDKGVAVSSAQAIAQGISKDGGLFVPETIPAFSTADFTAMQSMDYIGRAAYVLKMFLTDFTQQELEACVRGAYTGTFDNEMPAPLYRLKDKQYILELWHGPTCAFKDLALQLLPYLMTTAAKKVSGGKKIVILVATSGDTGKAALEGFKDVENTEIMVFYPDNGVSAMQKLQMDTQQGKNVFVSAIKGNFDDAQSGVKKIFTDPEMAKKLAEKNCEFSSANSINWGRLVPQIVYYVSAYCDLLNKGENLTNGFNVVVPTGNFGNILAAYYAKQMGVPVHRLICASNANNVLTDFIKTGMYDRNRDFYTTISPSMDILISSNLERMLYELSGRDDAYVAGLQRQLAQTGRYTVEGEVLKKLQELFYAGSCDDTQTLKTIREVYEKYRYLSDTHTGVALSVCEAFLKDTSDTRPVLVASTASPYKFSPAVLQALTGETVNQDEFATVDALHAATGVTVPAPLAKLKGCAPRFNNLCDKTEMAEVVLSYLE